jgi:hypothetical protein
MWSNKFLCLGGYGCFTITFYDTKTNCARLNFIDHKWKNDWKCWKRLSFPRIQIWQ